MLPFTKRPGRDESGDDGVAPHDDIVQPATTAPASKGGGRPQFASISDDEATKLMPSKSLGDAVQAAQAARSSPRPAAGAPAQRGGVPSTRPPAMAATAAAAPPATRSGKFAAIEDEEEDGRTVVRGAPKIVKRTNAPNSGPPGALASGASASAASSAGGAGGAGGAGMKMGVPTMPTTISPAAVIKATLESSRAASKPRTDRLMAGPPLDLLEDLADRDRTDVGAEHTAILQAPTSMAPSSMAQGLNALAPQMLQPQGMPRGTIPPGSARPMSNPPPNATPNATQSGGYAMQSGGYPAHYSGPAPAASASGASGVSGASGASLPPSMPAHFMMAQPPYSDGRIDPPGTAVTSRTKLGGRPAMSWAMALAAFAVFVGVGAVAVINGNDGLKETSASFVDPSRAGGAKAAAAPQPAAPTAVPAANDQPAPAAVPASPAATAAAAAPVVTTPPAAVAAAGGAPVAAAPVAAAPVAAAPAAKAAAVAAAPQPRSAPAPRAARPAAPAPPAAAEDAPVAAAPPTKPSKAGKGAKPAAEMDDETKKALDELQKAQLERSF